MTPIVVIWLCRLMRSHAIHLISMQNVEIHFRCLAIIKIASIWITGESLRSKMVVSFI
jgi:hypothetical protein